MSRHRGFRPPSRLHQRERVDADEAERKRRQQEDDAPLPQVRKASDPPVGPWKDGTVMSIPPMGIDNDHWYWQCNDAQPALRPVYDLDKFAAELGISRESVQLYTVLVHAAKPAPSKAQGPEDFQVVALHNLNTFDVLAVPRPVGSVTGHGVIWQQIAPREPTGEQRNAASQLIARNLPFLIAKDLVRTDPPLPGMTWVYKPAHLFER
jgi:hypothetical protein